MNETATPTVSAAGSSDAAPVEEDKISIKVNDLSLYYGEKQALDSISMEIPARKATAFIGPSGCGKSTLLRCFNRMNDLIDIVRTTGTIELEGTNINDKRVDAAQLRRRVGMVFQRPDPFPKSIYENVAYGMRIQENVQKSEMDERVEWALRSAALWDEVKDRLKDSALGLSGGQQQRLCIARAVAVKPEVLLFDEPTSALDPISTSAIEELIVELKKDISIAIVTHNMQQAARISDRTAFFYLGELIEYDSTKTIFTNPSKKQTEDYVTGRFG